ncbi:chloroplastic lipocalin isoform X2 [Rosa chinensis]|nr:chloroplastic lipocalin isoform X2 [Rosa chinensis]
MKCCAEQSMSNKPVTKHVLSGFAASLVLLSQINQAVASEVYFQRNTYELANAAEKTVTLPLDKDSDEGAGRLMMMRGMTANNFDPIRYSGRWYEVASLKRGFAGKGQEDCHCTQVNGNGMSSCELRNVMLKSCFWK